MLAKLLTPAITAVGKIFDDLHTSEEERLHAEIELRKLGLEEKRVEASLILGQQEINKEEAKHSSVFVAGARPAIMWIGGFALLYAAILDPFMRFASQVWFGYEGEFPTIDTTITMQILFGVLGLGAYRSVDKFNKVDTKAI